MENPRLLILWVKALCLSKDFVELCNHITIILYMSQVVKKKKSAPSLGGEELSFISNELLFVAYELKFLGNTFIK